MNKLELSQLLEKVEKQLLPQLKLESIHPHDPVEAQNIPHPWELIGAGNYAGVFSHPDYPQQVVKIYAPKRKGITEEIEVYRRLGKHPAFSECYHGGDNFLILKRLYGVTLYDCICQGKKIPEQIIHDIDEALEYAKKCGLKPHDVHGKNVMVSTNGRGLVVDISDFLHKDTCTMWEDLKKSYYRFYLPIFSPLGLRVPYFIMDGVRKIYRFLKR